MTDTALTRRRPETARNRWIALGEMLSIESPSHRARIQRLVQMRERPEHQPRDPRLRSKFEAETFCLESLLQSRNEQLSGYELHTMLGNKFQRRLSYDKLNAILVAVARTLRKELKLANRQDVRKSLASSARQATTPSHRPKEKMC